jgi:hypothetical protein
MVTLHAFLALAAGFLVSAVLVALLTAVLARFTPNWGKFQGKLQPGYAFVNIAASFLAASAGGYTTAWIAAANPLQHDLALAMAFLVLSAVSAMQSRGLKPIWFLLALVVLTPIGALAGGLLRLRVLGIL